MMRTGSQFLGIDPGSDAYRAVLVSGNRVAAACEVPTGDAGPAAPAARLVEALQRQGMSRPARCAVAPPETAVMTSVLELPPRSSGAPIESIAAGEMSRGRNSEPLEVAAWELPSTRPSAAAATEYIVVGVLREPAMATVAALSSCGIVVDIMDAPGTALSLVSAYERRMLVEVYTSSVRLHIVSAGVPRFCHVAALRPHEPVERQVVEQIDRCASFMSGRDRGGEIDGIILSGPGAREPGVISAVRGEFVASVEPWRGPETLRDAGSLDTLEDPAFGLALGAAVRAQLGRRAA
jgi:hypothetical protein